MAQHLSVQQKLASQRSLHLMVMLSFSLQLERSVIFFFFLFVAILEARLL